MEMEVMLTLDLRCKRGVLWYEKEVRNTEDPHGAHALKLL